MESDVTPHDDELDRLREVCARQRRQLAELNEVLHRKNVELDALHMVWCDGGCVRGVHRWTDEPLTEEIVATAERNTTRLRRWYSSARFRINQPMKGDWERERAAALAEKTAHRPCQHTHTWTDYVGGNWWVIRCLRCPHQRLVSTDLPMRDTTNRDD